jgi:hypothetical protein
MPSSGLIAQYTTLEDCNRGVLFDVSHELEMLITLHLSTLELGSITKGMPSTAFPWSNSSVAELEEEKKFLCILAIPSLAKADLSSALIALGIALGMCSSTP